MTAVLPAQYLRIIVSETVMHGNLVYYARFSGPQQWLYDMEPDRHSRCAWAPAACVACFLFRYFEELHGDLRRGAWPFKFPFSHVGPVCKTDRSLVGRRSWPRHSILVLGTNGAHFHNLRIQDKFTWIAARQTAHTKLVVQWTSFVGFWSPVWRAHWRIRWVLQRNERGPSTSLL